MSGSMPGSGHYGDPPLNVAGRLEHRRAVGRFRFASHLLTWISGRGNWWEANPAPAA
jgi:hypothetical protein